MPPVSAESIESSFFSLALAVLVVAVVAFVAVACSLSIGGARARHVLFGRAGEEGKDTKRARLCQLLCNSKQPTPK